MNVFENTELPKMSNVPDRVDIAEKAYFSVKEICDFYGVGATTIWRWDREGKIPPSVKIGGRRLFRIADHKVLS